MYNKEFKLIFDYAQNKVDDIEIYLSADTSFSVRIHEQNVEAFNYADSKGIGIRIIKNGKVGYSYTEEFDEKTFKMIVDEALENSKFIDSNKMISLEKYPDIKEKLDVYSEDLDKVTVDEKVQFAKDLERYAKDYDKRIVNVPYAVFGDGKAYNRIANSKGLDKEDVHNFAYAYTGILASEGNDKRMGMDFIISRDFKKFNAHELAAKSCKKGLDLLNGKAIKSGKYAVVFDNEMMPTLLSTFSSIFSAKSVQEGKSLLKGKLNKIIANEKVTIIDDGLYPGGFSTSAFDSEGFPSQKTVLVNKGKLLTFLHNTETAKNDQVSSTGNGSRGYKTSLTVAPTNFYLEPGNEKEDNLFKKYDQVIEIVSLQGMHSGANTVSGDFSLSAEGFLYDNGKRKHSLKPFTISGNILQLLHDVEAIADNFKFDMSSFGSASVLVRELVVSG
ncbi:MAG TPA: TldD/PmbA family protein [Candidatus Cloacimonetes bacterium]|nr:TldD/PmbA family protein [Candidatus Cloacimonadota bacterium]